MSDLINRKETEKMLRAYADDVGCARGEYALANGILKAVCYLDNIPTAFDLEGVIEQLKELKTYKLDMADTMLELMKRDKLGTYVCLEDVIEIIESAANAKNGKKGGRGNGKTETMSEMWKRN